MLEAFGFSDFIPDCNEIKNYLKNNNSNAFFRKHNRLILTGPTHTNLMDVGLINDGPVTLLLDSTKLF